MGGGTARIGIQDKDMCGKLFPTVGHPHRIFFDGGKATGEPPEISRSCLIIK